MASSRLKNWHRKSMVLIVNIIFTLMNIHPAYASTVGDLPFNSTLTMLQGAISGPFLLAAAIIMVVITCLMLAFGEWGDGFKKLINIVLWLSIAFGASNFISTMFGSGAVF